MTLRTLGSSETSYAGGSADITPEQLQKFVTAVEEGRLKVNIARTFALEDIQEAHRLMDENRVAGKMVVVLR